MNRNLILALAIPVIVFGYNIGDYYRIWDHLSCRASIEKSLKKLSSGCRPPESYMYSIQPGFDEFKKFISDRANSLPPKAKGDPKVITCIWEKVDLRDSCDSQEFFYIPDSIRVAYAYELNKFGDIVDDPIPIATIGEIRGWINQHRNTERFWMSTVFIGLLSIFIVIIDKKQKPSDR